MNQEKSIKPPEGNVQQPEDNANTPITTRTTTSKTWTNPRKRPHHQDPTSLFEPVTTDDALREEDNGKDLHASKRSRAAEWPLKNTDDAFDTREHDGKGDKRSSSNSIRPGKFLEGSMNDKVSQRPPSLYTKDEQAMEEYAKMQGNGQGEMNEDMDMTYDAGIESHKPSGMFRFGKAIANALKPFTAWQGMFKEKEKEKEKERSTSPEKYVLQDRQARAAEAYAELKRSGYKGTQKYCGIQESSAVKHEEVEKQAAPFRDSGIDMGGEQASAWTPNDQLIGSNDALLLSPPPPKGYAVSQNSDTSSARKPTHQLRKPSLQGLKKVASQIHLSPVKKMTEITPVPSIEINHASEATVLSPPAGLGLRREPSKKDIAKQYRLSKKVSDLENKLVTARRELELSISSAPPVPDLPSHLGRKPFTPSALPSLPSEGNMTPLQDTTAPPVPKTEGGQLSEILQGLPSKRNSARIASEPGVFAPMARTEELGNLKFGKGSAESARPRTSRGIKTETRSARIASESNVFIPTSQSADPRDMVARNGNMGMVRPRTSRGIKAQPTASVHKRLPEVPSETPHNSPLTYADSVPPIPTTAQNDLTRNDNLLTPTARVTDHTSVVHTDSPPSAFLGRPSANAPTRTRSKRSKHGISPPPPSLASAKKASVASDLAATSTERIELSVSAAELTSVESKALSKTKRGISPPPPSLASTKKVRILSDETVTPAGSVGSTDFIDDDLGPLRSVPSQKLNGDPVKKSVGIKAYPLPATRNEDFEWPEDVF